MTTATAAGNANKPTQAVVKKAASPATTANGSATKVPVSKGNIPVDGSKAKTKVIPAKNKSQPTGEGGGAGTALGAKVKKSSVPPSKLCNFVQPSTPLTASRSQEKSGNRYGK